MRNDDERNKVKLKRYSMDAHLKVSLMRSGESRKKALLHEMR